MKKGIGCFVLVIVLLLLTIIRENTGHPGGGGIGITFIICGMFGLGIWLLSSKKSTSSKGKTPNNQQTNTTISHHTIDADLVKKEAKQSESTQHITKQVETNKEVTKEKALDYSELSEIDKINRQFEKGIFSEEEKQKLINNILEKKQNEETEKIKLDYATVLNEYRENFQKTYDNESIELIDLNKQGIIDENTLNDKLSLLKTNIAKRIQKEIKFKCILGFEVFIGLGVNKIKTSFPEDMDEISGSIIEVVNSKEVRVKWDSNSISKPISLTQLSVSGVNKDIKDDWELSKENFLLKSDIEYYGLNLKIGDEYKDGIVFNISNTEINVFKRFKNTKLKSIRSDDYIMSDYNSLKSLEDSFWQIPNEETVNKFINFCQKNDRFIPVEKRIWTSDVIDFNTINCVELIKSDDNIKTSLISSGKSLMLYGILVHKMELKS